MKIAYTYENDEEILTLIHDCLCSGLPYFVDYGFELDWSKDDYRAARQALKDGGMTEDRLCIEDVQTQILRAGGNLVFINHEDDGEKTLFNLELAKKNWDKLGEHASRAMTEYMKENGDADSSDVIFQTLLLGEVIYG